MNSHAALPDRELDADVGRLASAVEELLQRITKIEPTVSNLDGSGMKLTSPLMFPDGIGKGEVIAELFPYRHEFRLDIHIDHNRFFAVADGSPSERPCFLNDYVASITIRDLAESLPPDFVRGVVAGVTAARDAVRRHNRRSQAPWNEVRVAALEEVTTE
jgi:hypothetical protein